MTGLEEEGTSLRNGCSSPSFFGFFLWEDGENIFTCTKHHSRCVIFHLGGRLKYEEKGVREHGVTTELYVHWGVVYAYPVQLFQGYLPVTWKPIITKSPEATFPESVYFNSPRKMHLKAFDLELNLQRVETLEAVSSTAAAVALEGWLPGTSWLSRRQLNSATTSGRAKWLALAIAASWLAAFCPGRGSSYLDSPYWERPWRLNLEVTHACSGMEVWYFLWVCTSWSMFSALLRTHTIRRGSRQQGSFTSEPRRNVLS